MSNAFDLPRSKRRHNYYSFRSTINIVRFVLNIYTYTYTYTINKLYFYYLIVIASTHIEALG